MGGAGGGGVSDSMNLVGFRYIINTEGNQLKTYKSYIFFVTFYTFLDDAFRPLISFVWWADRNVGWEQLVILYCLECSSVRFASPEKASTHSALDNKKWRNGARHAQLHNYRCCYWSITTLFYIVLCVSLATAWLGGSLGSYQSCALYGSNTLFTL